MSTLSGSQTRIDLARQAISNLLDTLNASATKVNVLVVDFADSAQTSGWRTIDGAKTYLSGLSAGGGTNYDAALERVQTAFNTGKPTAEQNITVFLSDGAPTTGGGITTNGDGTQVSQAEWESFLTAQNMPSFAIGIGSATTASLDPIAFDPARGTQPADAPVVYNSGNEGALLNALSGLVVNSSPNSFSGNLLSGPISAGGDTFGADGPAPQHIVAATFVSATGTTVVFRADAVGSTADVLRLIGVDGTREVARLDVNTQTGAYTLTLVSDFPHAIAGKDAVLKFAYTIQDGDGDRSTSNLTITIGDQTGGTSFAAATFAFSPAEQVGFTNSTGHVIGTEGTAVIHGGETARFDVQDVSGNSNLKFGALAVSQQFIAAQDQPITMTVAAIDGQGGIVPHVTIKAFAIVNGQWTEQTSVTSTANDDGTVTVSGLQTGLHLTIQSDVAFQALEFSNDGETANSSAGFKFTDLNIDLLDGPIDSSGSDSPSS